MPYSDSNDRLISQSQSLYHFYNVFRFVPLRFLNGKFFNLWFIPSTKNLRRKHGSALVVIFAYVACNTGSARFQNFEYDNTTSGEDLHCIYRKEYLSKDVLRKYPSISPEIIRMRD